MQRAIQNDRVGFISLCILVLFFQALGAYSQEFSWAKHLAASPRSDECTGVGTDAQGNIFVAGSVGLSGRFDGKELAAGEGGSFLAKYNSEGVQQWVRWREGGSNIVVDSAGNVYGSGWFETSRTIGDTVLASDGESCFLVKYGTEGHRLWVRVVSGKSYPTIACNRLGEVSIGVTNRGEQYATSATVWKYDNRGELVWSKKIESEENCRIIAMAMDDGGNVLLTGSYRRNITLDDTLLQRKESNIIYTVRYSSDGKLLWVRDVYTSGISPTVRGIVADEEKNTIIVGDFRPGTLYVGSDSLFNEDRGYDGLNSFLIKYDSVGKVVWLRGTDGKRDELGKAVTIDKQNNVYMAGTFKDSVLFGEYILVADGYSDLFVAKYSALGNIMQVQKTGSKEAFIDVRGVVFDRIDGIYICGLFVGQNLIIGDSTFTNAGEADGFMLKMTGVSTDIPDASYVLPAALTLFPHPVTDGVLNVSLPVFTGKAELIVNDILGRRVYNQTVQGVAEGTPVRVVLSDVPEGLYVLVLRGATGVVANSTFVVGR